jgi:trans-aconitate 2-methyltransferase
MLKFVSLVLSVVFSNLVYSASQGIFDARSYSEASNLQEVDAKRFLEKVNITESERVLDLGCGDGKITAYISTLTKGWVYGVDVSTEMVRFSSENYSSPNLLFSVADVAKLPFYNQFDKIVSFNCLHWVLDHPSALASMHKSLKQNGMIFLMFPAKSSCNLTSVAEGLMTYPKWAPLFRTYTPQRAYFSGEEYKSVLEQSNFSILSVREIQKTFVFEDRDQFKRFIQPLLNFISHLTQAEQEEFTEDMVSIYMENKEFSYASLEIIAQAKHP